MRRSAFSAVRSILPSVRILLVAAITLPLLVWVSPVLAADAASLHVADSAVLGVTREADGIDQPAAEQLFASAEAAIWFPMQRKARWFETRTEVTRSRDLAVESLQQFRDHLERDFPGLRDDRHGPFLLKLPATARAPIPPPSKVSSAPEAAVFSESFEAGFGNWQTDDNTLGLYSWGATTCEARTGSRSADALRGGANTLSCSDTYSASVETSMLHTSCEPIAGATQAWLDTYVHIASESGYDTLGFYYADGAGVGRGYLFSGSWSAWFRIVFNLKQWYRVGDLTAASCPRLYIEFASDVDTQTGFGARIDDLTISNSAPSFLSCAINASPSTGAAPLAVNFTPTVTGGSSGTAYLWSFGDAAATTASTSAASFNYNEPGDYLVRLRVEEQGIRAYAYKTIRVTTAGACSLSCSANVPASSAVGSAVAFQSAAAATGCTQSPTYAWTFGDGQTSTQQNSSHVYSASGTYAWTVTASANGQSCTRSGSIAVSAAAPVRKRPIHRGQDDGSVASGTIGAAGGTLAGGGFTLTVPAGAFSTTASLRVTKAPAGERREEDVTDTYVLTGMPASVSGNLTVRLERTGSGTGLSGTEKYYISMDAPAYLKSRSAESTDAAAPFPIDGTLVGNAISATVPSSWSLFTAGSSRTAPEIAPDPTWSYKVKAEKLTRYETAHFYALAYTSKAAEAQSILALLEEQYARLTAFGFSFDCRLDGGQFRKIYVDPTPLGAGDSDPIGYHVSKNGPCGGNYVFNDYLQITTSLPSSSSKVRGGAAHELFHLVQDIYSPGGARANLWLKEASSVWLETTLGGCPDVQSAYNMFPWNGLFNSQKSAVSAFWTSDREQRHGYGASYALKYRTDASPSATDPFVRMIWDSVRGGSSEIEAFQAALGSSLPEYWKAFSKDYFNGTATGSCFPSWASFAREPIVDEKSVPRSFAVNAYPLSSISWSLDLLKFKTTAAYPTAVSAKGLESGQSVFVYDVKSKTQLAELTKESERYAIDDLNKLTGSVLVLVFVDANLPVSGDPNGLSSTNGVTLSLGSDELKCYAKYRVALWKEPNSSGGYTACTAGGSDGCPLYDGTISDHFLGAIANNRFSSNSMWCPEPPMYCRWGPDGIPVYSNSLVFDINQKDSVAEGLALDISYDAGGGQFVSIDANVPLPLLSSSATGFEYRLTGADVCSSVSLSSSNRYYDIVCDSASYFKVTCESVQPATVGK